MESTMIKEEVEKKAFNYFASGYNCAESVFKSIIETLSDYPDKDIIKTASGFGGGIGGCKEELCGALAGGVMAIGYLYGRNNPGENIDKAKLFCMEYRLRFFKAFGAIKCEDILKSLGEQDNSDKCRQLTAKAGGILYELLADS